MDEARKEGKSEGGRKEERKEWKKEGGRQLHVIKQLVANPSKLLNFVNETLPQNSMKEFNLLSLSVSPSWFLSSAFVSPCLPLYLSVRLVTSLFSYQESLPPILPIGERWANPLRHARGASFTLKRNWPYIPSLHNSSYSASASPKPGKERGRRLKPWYL